MASGSTRKGRFSLDDKLKSKKYNHSFVKELPGPDVNVCYFQEHWFSNPVLVKAGLSIKLPSSNFTVKDIKKCVGSSRQVEAVDSVTGNCRTMSLKHWTLYYNSKDRDSVLSVSNLEFSHTNLESHVDQPEIVKLLDWLYQVWPLNLIRKPVKDNQMTYPQLQRYCVMTVAGCFTDFHIDIGGSSVWYHVFTGQKVVWLVPPTQENFEVYEEWFTAGNKDIFFGDEVKSCQRVTLDAGATLFIPCGWIHAVYSPVDSIVFCGNFLHSFSITDQLNVFRLEQRMEKPCSFPFFLETQWYALERYVDTVSRIAHRVKSDADVAYELEEEKARRNKALKDEADAANRRASYDDDTDVDESFVDKRSNTPTASRGGRSKTGQRSETSTPSSVSSRLSRSKLDDATSGGKNDDASESKRNRNWINLTRAEVQGLQDMVEFLEGLGESERHVPEDILLPDELLRDAKAMLAGHEQDDHRLAVTGVMVLPTRFPNRLLHKPIKHDTTSGGACMETSFDFSESPELSVYIPKTEDGSGPSSSGSIRRRRVRCRKCEACTRSECGECPFCKDMKKFGGLGKMKQTCVSRQCLAPILPTAAVCILCNKGEPSAGEGSSPSELVVRNTDPKLVLMECNVCWKIVHPSCLRDRYPHLTNDGVINDDLPNSWECPKCCDAGAPKNLKPRIIKGMNYVSRQLEGGHDSSSSDENDRGAASDTERENCPDKKPVIAAKPKNSSVKKKPEVTGRQTKLLKVSGHRRVKESLGDRRDGNAGSDGNIADNNGPRPSQITIELPDLSKIRKYVVRPAPIPPPPKHVLTTSGTYHPLDQNIWVHIFGLLSPADLARCMAVCKTWNRWGYDRRLWTSIDLSRHRIRQTHLVGIVRRQPKALDLSWTNISFRQLRWLIERLPHLRQLRLAGNSWPAVSALCSCCCPLLTILDIGWVAGVYDMCVRELVSPPRDFRPGLDVTLGRLRGCTELILAGSDITNEALQVIAQNVPSLERVDLSYCVGVDDDFLRVLAESSVAHTLTTVVLTGCVYMSSICFRYLARFPRLRRAAVEACPDISEKDCLAFAACHPNCVLTWKEQVKYVI